MTSSDGPAVLVVDDHAEIANLVRMVLVASGFHAVTAASADAAVEVWAQRSAFDLVVTDVTLPDRPGPALVAELGHPLARTLFISGHARERFVGTPAELPAAAAFLQKPFGPTELVHCLRSML